MILKYKETLMHFSENTLLILFFLLVIFPYFLERLYSHSMKFRIYLIVIEILAFKILQNDL